MDGTTNNDDSDIDEEHSIDHENNDDTESYGNDGNKSDSDTNSEYESV